MIYHYELESEIVLIDSTYRINLYNIPLIVDSGGRNPKPVQRAKSCPERSQSKEKK